MRLLWIGATAVLVAWLVASPASAQDWLVTPAPMVPLHVPLTPPVAIVPAPSVAPSAPHPLAAPHTPDELDRLIDPYGLSKVPTSLTARPIVPPLPSGSLPWMGAAMAQPVTVATSQIPRPMSLPLMAPPVVAFPNVPITWLLGY